MCANSKVFGDYSMCSSVIPNHIQNHLERNAVRVGERKTSFLNKETREEVTLNLEEVRCTRGDWKTVGSPRELNKLK